MYVIVKVFSSVVVMLAILSLSLFSILTFTVGVTVFPFTVSFTSPIPTLVS